MAGTTWPAVRRSHAADLVVAVDCSTTASKALIFDAGGRTLGQGRHAIPLAQPGPGRHEQSASDWWTATSSAVRTALAGLYPARVAAVVVTHQRETFCCLVDETEVRPAIVWMDSRAQRLVQTLGSEEVHAVSGRPPDNTPPLYKLAWLTRHEPLMIDRATRIGDVGAYLNLRLTGRWVSSWASADCLGLMDMLSRTWSEDLCALAGVRAEQLPGIVAPGEVIGGLGERAARELGLPPGTAVIAGAGDGQCAAVGAGAIAPGVLYLNMGTAIASGTTSPDYAWSKNHRTVAAASGTGFLYEAFLSSGTYMVNWFCREFGPFTAPGLDLTSEALLEAAASRVPRGADGLLALPYWNAAQTPYWDASARGAVVGWTGYHGKAHLIPRDPRGDRPGDSVADGRGHGSGVAVPDPAHRHGRRLAQPSVDAGPRRRPRPAPGDLRRAGDHGPRRRHARCRGRGAAPRPGVRGERDVPQLRGPLRAGPGRCRCLRAAVDGLPGSVRRAPAVTVRLERTRSGLLEPDGGALVRGLQM